MSIKPQFVEKIRRGEKKSLNSAEFCQGIKRWTALSFMLPNLLPGRTPPPQSYCYLSDFEEALANSILRHF